MKPITGEQKEKLLRLKELGVIPNEDEAYLRNPREAVKIAWEQKVIEGWIDNGTWYVLHMANGKPQKVKTSKVGDYLADKILSSKDPIKETKKPTTKKADE